MAVFFPPHSHSPLGWNHRVTVLQKRLFSDKNMFPYQKALTRGASLRFIHAGEEEKLILVCYYMQNKMCHLQKCTRL